VWKRIQAVDVEPEGILLEGVRSEGADAAGHADLDVRQLREGVRAASVQDELAGKEATVLLSRMLSEAQVGEAEEQDPAVRMLRESFRAGEVPDQELQVGQVLLLPGLLPEGSLLYDLTVDEDHSFVAAGLVVHNSHSPYDKYSLPTTPRSGDTSCRMNCRCHLEFEAPTGEQPETGVFGIPGQLGDELPRPTQGQSLADWLRPPEPPEGLSTPEGKDRLAVDSLQGEVNYWRRAISQIDEVADPEDFMAAVEARKAANSKLIDYLEERDLWDAPLLSVDEVITGRDISLLAERGLFELSVSGDALTETAEREVLRLIEKYELGIGKKY